MNWIEESLHQSLIARWNPWNDMSDNCNMRRVTFERQASHKCMHDTHEHCITIATILQWQSHTDTHSHLYVQCSPPDSSVGRPNTTYTYTVSVAHMLRERIERLVVYIRYVHKWDGWRIPLENHSTLWTFRCRRELCVCVVSVYSCLNRQKFYLWKSIQIEKHPIE